MVPGLARPWALLPRGLVTLSTTPCLLTVWPHLGTVLVVLSTTVKSFFRSSAVVAYPLVGIVPVTVVSTFSVCICCLNVWLLAWSFLWLTGCYIFMVYTLRSQGTGSSTLLITRQGKPSGPCFSSSS